MARKPTEEEKHLRIAKQVIHTQLVRLRTHPLSSTVHKDITSILRLMSRWDNFKTTKDMPQGGRYEQRVRQMETAAFALKIAGDLGESPYLTNALRLAVANLQDVAGTELAKLKRVRLDD